MLSCHHMRNFSVVNLAYPPACLLCQRRVLSDDACLCEPCERAMPRLHPPACQRCGAGLSGAYDARLVCQRCRQAPLAFDGAGAPFLYVDAVRDAVHAFKYRGHRRLGLWLAHRMAEMAQRTSWIAPLDLVVPVPMHWFKARVKGMNPADWLARTIGKELRRPMARTALLRTRWTATQTRLTRAQRARNVLGAFRASPAAVNRCRVLLVDDVFTTGATAHACALALREAGASHVSVLTAATAPSA